MHTKNLVTLLIKQHREPRLFQKITKNSNPYEIV